MNIPSTRKVYYITKPKFSTLADERVEQDYNLKENYLNAYTDFLSRIKDYTLTPFKEITTPLFINPRDNGNEVENEIFNKEIHATDLRDPRQAYVQDNISRLFNEFTDNANSTIRVLGSDYYNHNRSPLPSLSENYYSSPFYSSTSLLSVIRGDILNKTIQTGNPLSQNLYGADNTSWWLGDTSSNILKKFYCYGSEDICNPVLAGSQPCVTSYCDTQCNDEPFWVGGSARVLTILIPILIALAFMCKLGIAAVIFGRRKREMGTALNVYLGAHTISDLFFLICAGILQYLTWSGGGVSSDYYSRKRSDLSLIRADYLSTTNPTNLVYSFNDKNRATQSQKIHNNILGSGRNIWYSLSAKLARLDSYFMALSEAFWIISIYILIAAAIDRCLRWNKSAAGDRRISLKRCGTWGAVGVVSLIYVFGLASSLPRIWMAFERYHPAYNDNLFFRRNTVHGSRFYCRMYDWFVMLVSTIIPLVALFLLSSLLTNVICRDRRRVRKRVKELKEIEKARGPEPVRHPYILDSDEPNVMVTPTGYIETSSTGNLGGSGGDIESGIGTVVTPLRRPPPPPHHMSTPYYAYNYNNNHNENLAENYMPNHLDSSYCKINQCPKYSHNNCEIKASDEKGNVNDKRDMIQHFNTPKNGHYGRYFNRNANNSNEKWTQRPIDDYNNNMNRDYESSSSYDDGMLYNNSSDYYNVSERGILMRHPGAGGPDIIRRKRAKHRFWSRTRSNFMLASLCFFTPLLLIPFALSQIWMHRIQEGGPTVKSIVLSQIFQAFIYLNAILHLFLLLAFYDKFRHACRNVCCGNICDNNKEEGRDVGREIEVNGQGEKATMVSKNNRISKIKIDRQNEGSSKRSGICPFWGSKKRQGYQRADNMNPDRGDKSQLQKIQQDTINIGDEDADFARPRPATPMAISMLSGAAADNENDNINKFIETPMVYDTEVRNENKDLEGGGTSTFKRSSNGLEKMQVRLVKNTSPPFDAINNLDRKLKEPYNEEETKKGKRLGIPYWFGGTHLDGSTKKSKDVGKSKNRKKSNEKGQPNDVEIALKDTHRLGDQQSSAIVNKINTPADQNNLVHYGEVDIHNIHYNSLKYLPPPPATTLQEAENNKNPDVVVYRSTTTTLSRVADPIMGNTDQQLRSSYNKQQRDRQQFFEDNVDDYIDSSGKLTRGDIEKDPYKYGSNIDASGNSAITNNANRVCHSERTGTFYTYSGDTYSRAGNSLRSAYSPYYYYHQSPQSTSGKTFTGYDLYYNNNNKPELKEEKNSFGKATGEKGFDIGRGYSSNQNVSTAKIRYENVVYNTSTLSTASRHISEE